MEYPGRQQPMSVTLRGLTERAFSAALLSSCHDGSTSVNKNIRYHADRRVTSLIIAIQNA